MPRLLEQAWAMAQARAAAMDPKLRQARGVVHTPPALAQYVLARLAALICECGLGEGLEAPLTFVDPAVGTGVFPAALYEAAGVVRLLGFDVDRQALSDAQALLSPLSPTLVPGSPLASLVPHPWLAPDAEGPLIVLGNPPWAGRSASRGEPLSDLLLEDFSKDRDGRPLGEKKKGVLSDDYVRFVRWALEVVSLRRSGGAIALLTNASWLDGPVHRGMRRMLHERLDVLEILDLGGSALVARVAGTQDENLFGVRPGAALLLGARAPIAGPTRAVRSGTVRFGTVRGSITSKLERLKQAAPLTEPVSLYSPHYFFSAAPPPPKAYLDAPSIADWLPFHREGLQTNRDALVVAHDAGELVRRAHAIARGEMKLEARQHFDPKRARAALAAELDGGEPAIRPVAYRPFDDRFYLASPVLCHRPRAELARAIDHSELVLVTTRQDRGQRPFQHLVLTRFMPDNCLLSLRSSCRARAFPSRTPEGAPNLGPEVLKALQDRLGSDPLPQEVLLWVASHLGSPAYVAQFDVHLRHDYPRVPLPANEAVWKLRVEAARALGRAFFSESHPGQALQEVVVGHHQVRTDSGLAQARAQLDAAVRHIV